MFARYFIDRPVAATVLSVVVVILGLVALIRLPIAQYPEVAPPTIQVTTVYPGASAAVVAETVATPLEAEINGVEDMLYMSSRSGNDGSLSIDITFKLGTNLDIAQVLVQNRVAIANSKLPEEVRRQGVTTKKRSPSILLVVNLISPDNSRDQLYLSNYATLQIKDTLARLPGVGDIGMLGARDYSLRIWLDPEQMAARNLTAGDVMQAVSEQNVQVAAGQLGQPPVPPGQNFQFTINTLGRLIEPKQFADIVVKIGSDGQLVRLREVARVELGAKNYDTTTLLDGIPSAGLAIYQRPGTNALQTAHQIRETMASLKRRFPAGVDYRIVYDTTVFVEESITSVYHTLIEAFILVFLVVLVFLQDWRATILPMIDVPVSLIGTFAIMTLFGFTLNNLTLFGLVLAIGIVVDDAIVVVENVERWMATGLDARSATIKAMDEVTGPVIAITLVLCAVFIPTAFIAGISGQFYRQFALTIAASTVISALNAMSMTPSRAVQLFKNRPIGGHGHGGHAEALPPWGIALLAGGLTLWLLGDRLGGLFGIHFAAAHAGDSEHPTSPAWLLWTFRAALFVPAAILGRLLARPVNITLGVCFRGFNAVFDVLTRLYGRSVALVVRLSAVMLLIYVGLLVMTWLGFRSVPVGFIPEQDKGYLVVAVQLPDGASLDRTEAVMRRVADIAKEDPATANTISIPGFSLLTGSNQSNMGTMFLPLKPFSERAGVANLSAQAVLQRLRRQFFAIPEAIVLVFGAPPVEGIGSTGGFKLQIEDRGSMGINALQQAVENLAEKGNAQPGLVGLFSTFRASQPQIYLQINREKAKAAGVALNDVFQTLQGMLGAAYVNDFTRFSRNWQVNMQADASFRLQPQDIGQLKVRNNKGDMVPLSTLLEVQETTGPALVNHYQLYTSAEISGNVLPGTSSGQAIALMSELAERELPASMSYEWTELSLQQIEASKDLLTILVFPLGVIFVYLVLAWQYESWSMPTAIILIVPMCLSAAIAGLWLTRLDNNIFTQIGLVVLIALASKNAILIVEFARQLQDQGRSRLEAVVQACQLRLRPILMTSFAFILGVLPLVRATGAGAEMRVSLGVAVFSGMLGVTFFGLIFTPVFYSVIRWWAGDRGQVAGEGEKR